MVHTVPRQNQTFMAKLLRQRFTEVFFLNSPVKESFVDVIIPPHSNTCRKIINFNYI